MERIFVIDYKANIGLKALVGIRQVNLMDVELGYPISGERRDRIACVSDTVSRLSLSSASHRATPRNQGGAYLQTP